MLNKLFLSISLSLCLGLAFNSVATQDQILQAEVAPCQNGFDDVDVCQLRS